MPKVTVLRPFVYKGKQLEKDEVHDLPEHAVRMYEKIDFVAREKGAAAPAKAAAEKGASKK